MGKKASPYVQMEMFGEPVPDLGQEAVEEEGSVVRDDLLAARERRSELIKATVENQDKYIRALTKKGFSRDEIKVLRAGFSLVKYIRDEKKVLKSCADPMLGWFLMGISPTYAAAERRLKDLITDPKCIQTTEDGTIDMTGGSKRLYDAGFDFYRHEGIMTGHGSPRIKQASKNWGNWQKFASEKEVKAAWAELMKNEKALEG